MAQRTRAIVKTVEEKATREIPDDPGLPLLGKIGSRGLAETLPELGCEEPTLRLCNHHPGSRATLEVRDGTRRRFAIKIYANDPAAEAEVYQRMAVNGLAGDSGPRVPQLVRWYREQKILVLSWLEGPSTNRLVKDGKGRRAGELASDWLRAVSTVEPGNGPPPRSGGYMLYRVGMAAKTLISANAALGATAIRTAKILVRTQPEEDRKKHLVHGTLYARHIFDMGDGPGVIDWDQSGLGPLEVDAGMFLATISRTAMRHNDAADEAKQAVEAFTEGVRGLVEPKSLEWYWAASLLRLSVRGLETELNPRPAVDAGPFVAEAARRAEHLASGATL